ncbi:hypothetical protein [Flavobacterium sp. CAU 1735]|uniref:hypothetical protein n=1 Tax=Flavobacterium sp. CAU 1735 TaxID=3140361 RepID=UPI003261D2D8
MDIFDHSKSLIENIYLISGPIIALLGFVAFSQLRLSKKVIELTSKRQAAELSAKQIEIYCNVIIPSQSKLSDGLIESKLEDVNINGLRQFTTQELLKKMNTGEILERSKFISEKVTPILEVLNSMEAFSTYFTKGVADEEIAFSSIGSTFCYSVNTYSFIYCILRDEKDEVLPFSNTIKLYEVWNSKLQTKKIKKELKQKTEELRKVEVEKINILGTK